jgi:hypothetical protein
MEESHTDLTSLQCYLAAKMSISTFLKLERHTGCSTCDTEHFCHTGKYGNKYWVHGKKLTQDFHYHKEDNLYWCTHTPTGLLLTSSKTIKSIKALLAEPEFFDEHLTIPRMFQAYRRYANQKGWQF